MSVVEMFSTVLDIVAPLWTEFVMFSLAAVVYTLFTGTPIWHKSFWSKGQKQKSQVKKAPNFPKIPAATAAPVPQPQLQRRNVESKSSAEQPKAEDLEQYQQVLTSAKAGNVNAVLTALSELPDEVLPVTVGSKVLLMLSRCPDLNDELMHQIMDFASRFDVKALDAASAEASRWRKGSTCRQLYNVASLVSIPKSDRCLSMLVRGHSKEPEAFQVFLDDVTAPGSGNKLTRRLFDDLVAECTTAKAPEGVKLLQERWGAGSSGRFEQPVGDRTAPSDLSRTVSKAIISCGKDGNLRGAIGAFQKAKESGVTLTTLMYNCLLDACIECKDLRQALRFFAEMKEAGLADLVSYNTMMKGHLSNDSGKAAKDLMMEMTQKGLVPNRISYHGLLHGMVQRGDRTGTWELVEEMGRIGLKANAVTCSILLKGVQSNMQSYRELDRILALVDSSEQVVDEVLFASMVEASIRARHLDALWDRLQKYEVAGGMQSLTAPTYGSMIKAFGQTNDLNRIRELWSQMISRKVQPTSITLGCMVEALVSNNQVEEAWELVGKIWEDPMQQSLVNTVIYSTIIKGFTMSKQSDKVATLYKEMKARGISCNTITYNTMLNALAKCGKMEGVPQLLADMEADSPRVEPDIVTYSTIVKGYCMAGDLDKGLEVLSVMKGGKVKPDEVMYNSLLDGCARLQRLDMALTLLEEMKKNRITPSNYTLSIACKLLGRAKRIDEAFELVESISRQYNVRTNIQVYTCLMQACFHNRQLSRALSLHEKLASEGHCKLDEKSYTVLARGCLNSGAPGKAIEVARCAYHLPGHSLTQTKGAPLGVERRCLDEIVKEVGRSQAELLLADLQEHRGITLNQRRNSP
eukprot:TRINITY_DN17492_c0_g1_i1.p1 TRINITY_DN17492_c0_g1~~TRINITY_DN17492_c0_g1_i1.p1  ORF type:complete len:862 (+),score=242.26 TRINITY_DN17492_c0_g1_i1:277-2862(+)